MTPKQIRQQANRPWTQEEIKKQPPVTLVVQPRHLKRALRVLRAAEKTKL